VRPGHRFATRPIPAGEFVIQYGQPIGTSLGIERGDAINHENMTDDVPVVRDLPADLHAAPPEYFPEKERATFMGFRRPDGRVGTRNFVLIVPTSMCASHESQQISIIAEYTMYSREQFPNVDGVVAIPHNKGCGCQDGSTIEVMLRTLANYADHPNVGGVILIDLGCEKTNLSEVEKYLLRTEMSFNKPMAKIGIQDVGGTQAANQQGLKWKMLPQVNQIIRKKPHQ
jgi:altronate hydrolase